MSVGGLGGGSTRGPLGRLEATSRIHTLLAQVGTWRTKSEPCS